GLEVTNCDLKAASQRASGNCEEQVTRCDQFEKAWWGALPALCVHRTRHCHVVERPEQQARCESQHRNHARVCEAALGARDKSRTCEEIFRAGTACRQA